jgi:hypothetical protein
MKLALKIVLSTFLLSAPALAATAPIYASKPTGAGDPNMWRSSVHFQA